MTAPIRPTQPRKIWLGVGIALLAHLLTIVIPWGIALVISGEPAANFLALALIGQVIVMIAALAVGITLTVKREGGVGAGILIGWAIGLMISPVIGFGVCVSLIDGSVFG